MTRASDAGSVQRPVVLVTGASAGIGRATARLFVEHGFRVFGTSRRQRPDTDGVEMLVLDVRSDESVRDCVGAVLERAGRLDVLVNNAGVEQLGFVEETTSQQAHQVFATNFFGVVRLTDAVLPGMRERRCGRVINVGSLAAWIGEPGEGFYAASKAALARYTEALRHEVRSLGIGVCLVEPGAITTGVLRSAGTAPATIADYDGLRDNARRALQAGLERGADPSRAARRIVAAARSRAPRARYGVGRGGRWLPVLRVLVPQWALDRLVERAFGLR